MKITRTNTDREASAISETPEAGQPPAGVGRRSFMRSLGLASSILLPAAGFSGSASAKADDDDDDHHHGRRLHRGDAAILRFLAAAELIEEDLWQQYTELALGNPAYGEALGVLDEDMGQYISDNTDDEVSHASFLNAYLESAGETPVNFKPFLTLPGSQATGSTKFKRLTNLSQLNVDTSWWLRYRSAGNPDFGDSFPQFIDIRNRPTIPMQDLPAGDELQAIANSAAFHFAAIEQGGTSLYASFLPRASSLNTIQILAGIGGSEVVHFAIWHDKAGNAPEVRVPGVSFPDMESFDGDESRQKNLIMPEPCKFVSADLPLCSVIRPTSRQNAGAVAAANAFINSGLFTGQTPQFFQTLMSLARSADAAFRRNDD